MPTILPGGSIPPKPVFRSASKCSTQPPISLLSPPTGDEISGYQETRTLLSILGPWKEGCRVSVLGKSELLALPWFCFNLRKATSFMSRNGKGASAGVFRRWLCIRYDDANVYGPIIACGFIPPIFGSHANRQLPPACRRFLPHGRERVNCEEEEKSRLQAQPTPAPMTTLLCLGNSCARHAIPARAMQAST